MYIFFSILILIIGIIFFIIGIKKQNQDLIKLEKTKSEYLENRNVVMIQNNYVNSQNYSVMQLYVSSQLKRNIQKNYVLIVVNFYLQNVSALILKLKPYVR